MVGKVLIAAIRWRNLEYLRSEATMQFRIVDFIRRKLGSIYRKYSSSSMIFVNVIILENLIIPYDYKLRALTMWNWDLIEKLRILFYFRVANLFNIQLKLN